jgi:hypothetical protein
MKKRIYAHEIQKGDIICFRKNSTRLTKTIEVGEVRRDNIKYPITEIIDTNGDEIWFTYTYKVTVIRN